MPHIHTEPGQHDFTASAFIMRETAADPELLVIMHKKLGTFMQPGGHVELNETPWQTIVHEVREETGIAIDRLSILQPKLRIESLTGVDLHPVPLCVNTHKFSNQNHFHTDLPYAFVCRDDVIVHPDEGESQEHRWVTESDIDNFGDDEMYANVREIAKFALRVAYKNYERIAVSVFS